MPQTRKKRVEPIAYATCVLTATYTYRGREWTDSVAITPGELRLMPLVWHSRLYRRYGNSVVTKYTDLNGKEVVLTHEDAIKDE